jgi:hypothetical protein
MPRLPVVTKRVAAALVAVGGACAASNPVWAQEKYYGDSQPASADGRDFAGAKLPVALRSGDVTIRASRAWAWNEGSTGATMIVGPDGTPVGTQRLFLQGDVVVEMAGYRFTSAQAVVWSQIVPGAAGTVMQGGEAGDRQARQIAVFFDRVADPGAKAGYAQAADRLLVTAKLEGVFDLHSDSIVPGRPDGTGQTGFLAEGERRLASYLRELAGGAPAEVEAKPIVSGGTKADHITPGLSRPYEPNSPLARTPHETAPKEPTELPTDQKDEPLFAKNGLVTFAVGTRAPDAPTSPEFGEKVGDNAFIRTTPAGEDTAVLLSGGVALQYTDLRKTRNLLISAERAVVFLPPGGMKNNLQRFNADEIRGIYLEGDVVATDGQYTLRGPRVWYDFVQNKAVMADAVFSTVDAKTGLPFYVRAKTLRQEAANRVTAESARLSTTSFFKPVFSIGASTVTVTETARKQGGGGGGGDGDGSGPGGGGGAGGGGGHKVTYVEAHDLTFRGFGVPFFWLPGFQGELDKVPLQDVRVENSSQSGGALKTTWDTLALFGAKNPPGLNTRLLLDYYFDRGFAMGTRTDWKSPTNDLAGQVFAYMLTNDDGRDTLSNGVKIEQDEQFRGIALAENRWDLDNHWTLFGEFSKISDQTFVDAFFRDLGAEGREMTTEVTLRYLGSNSMFSVGAKGALNDFTANQYLVQSQGYMVNKLPEVKYARLADDILGGIAPGALTWTHEYSYARVGFKFNEPNLQDFGFVNGSISNKEFGVAPNMSIGDRLRSEGFTEEVLNRVDTRQEFAGVFDLGPIRVNPFVVGRFTGYDEKIGEFYTASPDADKQYRIWYAGGARFSTEITKVDDAVESSFFDLHRIRHIITPSATVWTAGSTIREESLPIYDDSVEALATGTAVRAGMDNTWQTQRGGPGRWHSVDVLKINTDVTFATADRNNHLDLTQVQSPIVNSSPFGRFFDARPEYSYLGNYFTGDATWQATDAVGLIYSVIYDFDTNQVARTVAGGTIQHTPEFSTYAQVRFLDALHSTYVDAGVGYQLTRVYSISAGVTYDTNRNEIQNFSAVLRRKFQDATLGVRINVNNITDETSIGVVFEPQAVEASRAKSNELTDRLRDVGR